MDEFTTNADESVDTVIQFNDAALLNPEFREALTDAFINVLMEFNMTGNTWTIDVQPNGA